MTSHNDQIRALIAEIDATLEKPSNLLGRLSGEGAKNRDTLEHLRDYLLNLQNSVRRARIRNNPAADDLASLLGEATLPGQAGANGAFGAEGRPGQVVIDGETVQDEFPLEMGNATANEGASGANAEGQWQGGLTYGESTALIQQLGHDLEQLRAGLMAPLHGEINQLQRQRGALVQELQRLQLQHSGAQSEQQLHEFVQQLMARLQERLVAQVTAQISQALPGLAQSGDVPHISGNTLAALPGEAVLEGATRQNAIALDPLQGGADVLLQNLDRTLKEFAQTLEHNLQGYKQSIDQSLERINRMGGVQGEGLMAEIVNRLADQMEAQGSIHWNELGSENSGLTIGGESPMGLAGSSPRQLSSRSLNRNAIALDGPELTLDSLAGDAFEEAADESTSSAGIARRRILAAQSSESRAQQSLELESRRKAVQSANSLEDFYATVGAPNPQGNLAQQRAMAVQNRASLSRPGAVKGHYRNLEDALFDGIPAGDNPWAQSSSQSSVQAAAQFAGRRSLSSSPAALQPNGSSAEAYPPQSHRIHSLTDLVDRRFDDFGPAGKGEPEMPESLAAFYGELTPSRQTQARRTTTGRTSVKKKSFLNRLHLPKSA